MVDYTNGDFSPIVVNCSYMQQKCHPISGPVTK